MPKRSGALSCCVGGLLALWLWLVHAQAWAQAEAPPVPALGQLSLTNPFDANRKLWPDRTPPLPPPPVPVPVTDADLEVYGVVIAGGAQKALLKLGKRFEGVPVGPTGIAVVPVGARLGEFVLTQMTTDQILLKAPGGEQWIRFSLKKDRAGGTRVAQPTSDAAQATLQQPVFTPSVAAQVSAPASPMGVLAGGQSTPSAAPPPTGVPIMPTGAPAQGGQAEASPTAPQAGSLAAAIMAAQAAQKAAAASGGSTAPVPGINPFEALLQQQKK